MTDYILPPRFVYGKMADGNGYLISSLQDVPANDSANVHIRNPHSDKVMWLAAMQITAEGNNEFYIHDNLNSVSDGDEISIQNTLMNTNNGSPDNGPFETYENSTYTSEESYPIGFTIDKGPANTNSIDIIATAMEPDRQMVVEIQNKDGSSNTVFFGALMLTPY